MKIALAGDGINLTTSYGKVNREMALWLVKHGHDVYSFALQYNGEPVKLENGITLCSFADQLAMARSFAYAKPDAVLHLRDNWIFIPRFYRGMIYHLMPLASAYNTKVINYSPIQSAPLPKEYVQTISDEAHFTFTMTKWGVERLVAQGAPVDRLGWLYHGCDFSVHKPVTAHRAEYGLPENGTMVMMVGMHLDYRKMQPLTLMAFSEYLKYDPTAFIYMHADVTGHYALDTHVEALGLAGRNKVFFKPGQGVSNLMTGVTDGQMNELFNCADIYVSLSGSEGFDLPAQEAAATGLPIVITDFPVHRELFGDYEGAYFVPARKILPTAWGTEWIADPVAAAKLMKRAVKDGRRKPFRPPKFRWDSVMKKFLKRVDDVLSE